jgi:hypothetical protein
MFTHVRVLCTLFMNRYRALREDEGASTVEWVALILIGVGVAGAVALIVRRSRLSDSLNEATQAAAGPEKAD